MLPIPPGPCTAAVCVPATRPHVRNTLSSSSRSVVHPENRRSGRGIFPTVGAQASSFHENFARFKVLPVSGVCQADHSDYENDLPGTWAG